MNERQRIRVVPGRVPSTARVRRAGSLGLAGFLWLGLAGAAAPVPLKIDIAARELVPGEPVRVTVTAEVPLSSATASFLGREVALLRGGDGRWSGWSVIGLDESPGATTVDARGTSAGGRDAVGTLAVVVRDKDFPREELGVAPRYVTPPPEVQARLDGERKKLNAIYAARTPRPLPARAFVRPVAGEATSIFGTRRVFNGEPRSPHPGLDLRAAEGTLVRASGPGRVVLAMDLYYSGNTVIVDHGGGLYTLYAHLSEAGVVEGQEVAAGEVVGRSGSTGRVTGPHLHWGAKIGDRPFNPEALLDPSLF